MPNVAERLRDLCNADGEFRVAARFWTGSLRFDLGFDGAELILHDGVVLHGRSPEGEVPAGPGHLGFRGPEVTWRLVLSQIPPPFYNDIVPAQFSGVVQEGDLETFWQYYPAVRRAVELLRSAVA